MALNSHWSTYLSLQSQELWLKEWAPCPVVFYSLKTPTWSYEAHIMEITTVCVLNVSKKSMYWRLGHQLVAIQNTVESVGVLRFLKVLRGLEGICVNESTPLERYLDPVLPIPLFFLVAARWVTSSMIPSCYEALYCPQAQGNNTKRAQSESNGSFRANVKISYF